jgi:hypothetical protein
LFWSNKNTILKNKDECELIVKSLIELEKEQLKKINCNENAENDLINDLKDDIPLIENYMYTSISNSSYEKSSINKRNLQHPLFPNVTDKKDFVFISDFNFAIGNHKAGSIYK